MLSITSIRHGWKDSSRKKQKKGKCTHFFIKSIFDYNSKKNPVNTPNDEQLVEAFTFICEDTVVWANKTSLHHRLCVHH